MRQLTKRLTVMLLIGMFCVGLLSPPSAETSVTKRSSTNSTSRRSIVAKTKKVKIAAKGAVSGKGVKKRRKQTSRLRCEPQSLTYARQRSGIMRSRTGSENGPLTWFASEKKLGKTTKEPDPGSILILGANKGHGMPTGHVAYVEKVYAEGPSSYKIIFSHTNYDRKCSLETNIEAIYNSTDMTLDIFSGAWKPWGSGLRVAGFIQD